jgi:hypothetical protein
MNNPISLAICPFWFERGRRDSSVSIVTGPRAEKFVAIAAGERDFYLA